MSVLTFGKAIDIRETRKGTEKIESLLFPPELILVELPLEFFL